MGTNFKLRQTAVSKQQLREQVQATTFKNLLILHEGDVQATQLCIEGIVDVLGGVQARLAANKDPLEGVSDPRHRRIMMGVIAAAQILKDHPDAVEAHNLSPNKLRQVMAAAGEDVNATKMLLQVAQSAPSATSEVVKKLQQASQAVEQQDTQTLAQLAKEFQLLWMYWQQQSSSI